jgi:hypothetical protein
MLEATEMHHHMVKLCDTKYASQANTSGTTRHITPQEFEAATKDAEETV